MRFNRVVISAVLVLASIGSICSAGPVTRLYLKPGHLSVRPDMQQKFEVYGLDAFDREVPITEPLTWSTQTNAGSVTQTGQFTAGTVAGRYMQGVKVTTPSGVTGLAIVTVSTTPAVGGYIFERSWGDFIPGDQSGFRHRCVGPNDTLLFADINQNRIVQYNSDGGYVNQIGPLLDYNGMYSPGIMTSDGTKIYITDANGIQVLDSGGKNIGRCGSIGTGNGQYGASLSFAAHKSGNIYVADFYNYRVQKFGPTGDFILQFGSQGTGDGQFSNRFAICVDPVGNIYAADVYANRVQKFGPGGNFIAKWTTYSSDNLPLPPSSAISSDPLGNIYLSTAEGFLKLAVSDQKINKVTLGVGIVDTDYPVLFDSAGNYYVNKSEPTSSRHYIAKHDPQGNVVAEWGHHRKNGLSLPQGIGVGPDGNVFVADSGSWLIRKYDPFGNLMTSWDGGFRPVNVRIDPHGMVFATNGFGVSKYSPTGELLKFWALPAGDSASAYGLALAPNGDIYVSSEPRNTIYRYDSNYNLINQWGSTGSGAGQFDRIHSLAVDANSIVYAVDSWNHRIQKFDAIGNYIGGWGGMDSPWGICVSPNGYIFTAEEGAERVQKFTTSGLVKGAWGSSGHGAGQHYGCNDVAVDVNDNVYVVDWLNNRVCKYAPTQTPISKAKQLKDGDFVALSNQVVTATSTDLGDCIYIEAPDRSTGIRVTGVTSVRGYNVTVMGALTTVNGERTLRATSITAVSFAPLTPIGLTNKALGGGDLNYDPQFGFGQRGVEDGEGANNIGLLVKTSGKVTGVGSDFFYIDDGTHAHDSSIFVGVRVQCRKLVKPKIGQNVTVTGISRINKIGDRYFRSLSARIQGDIVVAQ